MSKLSPRVLLRKLLLAVLNTSVPDMSSSELKRSAIVFAPHQDDETLGCGGTIIRKKRAGADLKIVFLTDGSRSHQSIAAEDLRGMRIQEAIAAARQLGVPAEDVIFIGIQDGELMQHQAEAIAKIQRILAQFPPEEVYIPYRDEPMFVSDHTATYQAVISALERGKHSVRVYEYPVWFWRQYPWTYAKRQHAGDAVLQIPKGVLTGLKFRQEFNHRVNTQEVLALKRSALNEHKSQIERPENNPKWTILSDFSEGQWLECCFQNHEFFHQEIYQNGLKVSS